MKGELYWVWDYGNFSDLYGYSRREETSFFTRNNCFNNSKISTNFF